jgi:hypothetical protein
MRSSRDLPLDKRHKRLLIHLPVPERRDEGGYGPFEQHDDRNP